MSGGEALASCEENEKLSGLLHAYYWVMLHAYCLDVETFSFSDTGCIP